MTQNKQAGEVNILVVMVVFLLLSTVALGGLSVYYITQYNRAQTTVDQQRAEAAATAKDEQKQADEVEFAARQKEPYRTYQAPPILGNITLSFPKTWNVYATEDQEGATQLDLYFNPDSVKAKDHYTGTYALRLVLEKKLYTEVVNDNMGAIEDGTLTAKPIKVAGITGTSYQGQVTEDQKGVKIILPIRDKTLSIWTESFNYTQDFSKILSLIKISP